MNWGTFIITVFVSAFLVYPMFEFLQGLSIKKGEIPVRGVRMWKGRNFLFWTDYKTLKYGDLIFLSFLNGFVVSITFQLVHIEPFIFALIILFGVFSTVWWLTITRRDFMAGKLITRWDWHFTAPSAKMTIGGKYHLLYFFAEACIVGLSVYLFWQSIDMLPRVGIIISLFAYVCTVLYDVATIGMSISPFPPFKKI